MMDISKIKKIYMIGIKGVGMTMLAQYLKGKGIEVTGSDTNEKFMTDQVLANSHIKVIENFHKNNIPQKTDLIIYSTAYNANTNPEVAEVIGKENVITYAQALGLIFNEQFGIAIVGSHGKTTTTAWLGYVLNESKLYPTVMVGAHVPQFEGSGLIGNSDFIIAELDEYQNKLQYCQPKAVLLNNIEYDHPDFFPTTDSYNEVFIEFIKKIPTKGFLVANYDDPVIRKIINVNCRGKIITYGINEVADYIAYDIKQTNDPTSISGGKQYFKVKFGTNAFDEEEANEIDHKQDILGDFCVQLLGKHNVYNALAVIACAVELNIDLRNIRTYLEEFKGTERRTQLLGEFRGAKIIDDYAHHPTEIQTTLDGVRALYPNNKLIVVFHPHTFTRTKALLDEFARSFDSADQIIVLDIYGSAREKHGGVSSQDLVKKIQEHKKDLDVNHISTLEKVEKYLRNNLQSNQILILMGAGDVFRVGNNLVN